MWKLYCHGTTSILTASGAVVILLSSPLQQQHSVEVNKSTVIKNEKYGEKFAKPVTEHWVWRNINMQELTEA
jgi:hypothetical protein